MEPKSGWTMQKISIDWKKRRVSLRLEKKGQADLRKDRVEQAGDWVSRRAAIGVYLHHAAHDPGSLEIDGFPDPVDCGVVPTRNLSTVSREVVKVRESKGAHWRDSDQPLLSARWHSAHILQTGQLGQEEECFSVLPSPREEGRDIPWGLSSLQNRDINFCTYSSPTGLKIYCSFPSTFNLFDCWVKNFLRKQDLQVRVGWGEGILCLQPKGLPFFWTRFLVYEMGRAFLGYVTGRRREWVFLKILCKVNVMCLWRENLTNIQEQQCECASSKDRPSGEQWREEAAIQVSVLYLKIKFQEFFRDSSKYWKAQEGRNKRRN